MLYLPNIYNEEVRPIKPQNLRKYSYSLPEAVEVFGIGKKALYAFIHKGKLKASKPGKFFIIKHADMEKLLKEYQQ